MSESSSLQPYTTVHAVYLYDQTIKTDRDIISQFAQTIETFFKLDPVEDCYAVRIDELPGEDQTELVRQKIWNWMKHRMILDNGGRMLLLLCYVGHGAWDEDEGLLYGSW